jgi:hypothetical protein
LALALQLGLDLGNRDLHAADEHAVVLGHGDDELAALVGNGLGLGLGQSHVHAGLHDGRRDHEDDEQHQHDVDERRDVDFGKRSGFPPAAHAHAHG